MGCAGGRAPRIHPAATTLQSRMTISKDESMAKPKLKQHHINRDWCKGCGICVELCPKNVLELDDQDKVVVVRPQDCICCRLCELRCPDFAIEVETQE
jgi:2-oxoglutarate ferredoxin oxidoreductase subunit delta